MTYSHVSCEISLRIRNSCCPDVYNIDTPCVQNGSDVFVICRPCPAHGSIEQVQSGAEWYCPTVRRASHVLTVKKLGFRVVTFTLYRLPQNLTGH